MEYIDGYKIDDLVSLGTAGWVKALDTGVRAWMQAAFLHGFFHGDVQAGNLMIDRDAKLLAPDWTVLDDPELIGFLFDSAAGMPEERAG